MPNISDTVYPRLKANPSSKELDKIFTPTPEEQQFAWHCTTDDDQTLRLLVWLKTFQRLGYFPSLDEISARIFDHIAKSIGAIYDPVVSFRSSVQQLSEVLFSRSSERVGKRVC